MAPDFWVEYLLGLGYERLGFLCFSTMGGNIRLTVDLAVGPYNADSQIYFWYPRIQRMTPLLNVWHGFMISVYKRELLSILEACAKPELMPLYLGVKWAMPLVNYTLKGTALDER